MIFDINEWYQLEQIVTACLSMLICFGGFSLCFMYRNLSSRLLIIGVGFLALFALSGFELLFSSSGNYQNWSTDLLMITHVGNFGAYLLIVFGLGSALHQIRHRLALALEPTHGRS